MHRTLKLSLNPTLKYKHKSYSSLLQQKSDLIRKETWCKSFYVQLQVQLYLLACRV